MKRAASSGAEQAPGLGAGPAASAWAAALVAAVIGAAIFAPVGWKAMARKHIDAEWFRWSFVEDNLRHWLAAAPTENGFFRAGLDRQWRPAGKQVATLVSQSRLLFVFAAGYDVTGDPACLEAVRKGADFLIRHFRDDEYGGWFWQVSPEGKVLDEGKSSYGHAFVIFGLSHAYRVTGERRYADAALGCWGDMKRHLRYDGGGIKPHTSRDFTRVRGGNTQNPMMHLFEALLALHDATGSEEVFRDALELADFIFTRLYQSEGGYLPEAYDQDWKPVAVEKGGYVDLGHQFEWAFLLSRAVEKGFPQRYLEIGERLLDYGMRVAYDRGNGGIFSSGDYSGNARAGAKGWWQQCELLRALANHAARRGRDDLWAAFEESLAYVRADFIDARYGGWFGGHDPTRPREAQDTSKGSVWKVGYHDTGMYVEALRLARLAR